MNPLVSIVLICWNRKDVVLGTLENIFKINYDNYEVIVVDNASADNSAEEIEKQYPQVKLINMYKNIGIEAYNIGFKNAKGEYIVILDDDSFPEKNAVSRMVEKFNEDSEIGLVAFDVRSFYSYDEVINETIQKDTKAESTKYLMSFNGAGAGVRRDLFEKVGFYPEEFFLYYNETDTALRVLDEGYKIASFSDIVSYHKYSPQNRTSQRAPFYYTRNLFWVLWRNYPLSQAILRTIHLLYLCFYNSFEQKTLLYIKAAFQAFLNFKQIITKRKVVKDTVWKNFRLPPEMTFTYYR